MKVRIPQSIAMSLAIVAIIAFFLPYIVATENYSQYLESRASEKLSPSTDLTVGDTKEMSLFEYAKVYYQARLDIYRNEETGIVNAVTVAMIGVAGAFAFLCAWGKRPILLLFSTIIMGGAFYVTDWNFKYLGIAPNNNYRWGIAHMLLFPVAVALLFCAIWMFIAKKKDKKR